MTATKTSEASELVDRALEAGELDETLEASVAERLTESGRYWAKIGLELVAEAKACRGSRSRKAKLELLAMARSCFKTALDADKPAELVEVRRLADLLDRQRREAGQAQDLA
ncbi:hypothetical protein PPSIR1_06081 [Plesiocystis pacifica SIR-1]|uniref:Uncharacterized protein n=1 Tax=Plesiocystis pacifica SIR-1 TaxID=391625 RepID=A6G6U1_9BACT|nr:hypothetical protein [Plesiocystis pacifica]EDM78394.1 hypothetical protein PPSIR1_06081 [Plesiocystis pacifica SIR-1]